MSRPTVLLLESIATSADILLRENATVIDAPTPDRGGEAVVGQRIDAIITRGKGDVSRELIDACPDLRVIARCGVGLNNVDVDHASRKGIPVINLPGANAATVAEHTLGLMLALRRRLYASIREVKAGNWAFRNAYDGDELRGNTLGILGAGNIGRRVGALATAFGMKVVYWVRANHHFPPDLVTTTELPEVLSRSDVISLHLPLTPDTEGLLGAPELTMIKPGALLINTARAAIVDHGALLEVLSNGKLGGYAADVPLDPAPGPKDSLAGHDRVLLTPHVASLTATTYDEMCLRSVENTFALLAGKSIDPTFIHNRNKL